jgi:hypothetical protein
MSRDTDAVTNDFEDRELQQTFEGFVAESVFAVTDDLYVTLGQFQDDDDLNHRYGPCIGWDRRQDGSFPSEGDRILVTVSDKGTYWTLNWWPYS